MKIWREYLKINVRILDDNTKMDVKETGFVFRQFFTTTRTERDIKKVDEIILHNQ